MLDFVLLIPCYNDIEGLHTSLSSVNYRPEKHQILIIDDGSEPPISFENLKEKFPEKPITILRLEKNSGIVTALNTGLIHIQEKISVQYIARLDCNDTCHPDRFYNQVEFLDSRPDIFLLGSWCTFSDENGRKFLYKTKTEHKDIIKQMHFKCSFIHPTVMFRKDVLKSIGMYPTHFPHAEDYAFFWSILKEYKGAISRNIFINVKIKKGNLSSIHYKNQLKSKKKVIKNYGTNIILIYISNLSLLMKSFLSNKTIFFIKKATHKTS